MAAATPPPEPPDPFVPVAVTMSTFAIGAAPAVPAVAAEGTCPSVATLMFAPVRDPGAMFAPVSEPGWMSAPVSEPGATFDESMARAAIFALVTAPFLICFVPTLLAGKVIAAYEVADSAMNSAKNAVTFATVTLFRRIARLPWRITSHPFPEAPQEFRTYTATSAAWCLHFDRSKWLR